MLEVVYGDRVKAFGANGILVELRPQENTTHASEGVNLAQLFVSGEMIGRVATYYTNMTEAMRQTYGADGMRAIAFARRLSELRRATRQYLVHGRLLRPPAIDFAPDADAPRTRWNWSVLSGAHRAADGSVAFSFANARDSAEQRFSVRIVADEYGIPTNGTWALQRIDAAGSQQSIGTIRQRTISQTFTLPPLSAVVLVARPR